MNKEKAERKIRRKISRAKTCPFCGLVPKFIVRCDHEISEYGSFGHYAVRERCCQVTSSGQTELFFTNDFKKPDFRLWWSMVDRMVNDWNRRV